MKPVNMTVIEAATAIKEGRLTPANLVEEYLDRIRQWDAELHAMVAVYEDEARLAAEAATLAIRANHVVGPLHGVPVVVKDLVEVKGKRVTAGSTAWARESRRSAEIVKRFVAEGMIILGKTHLVQFALGGWGSNSDMGTPRNPWKLAGEYTPGGSSSGSGVAVAGGLAPWSVGTDTGGSVRIPAAWCGLTGLKVTQRAIDRTGVVAMSESLDTVGPLARDVKDAALLYKAMRGEELLLEAGYQEGVRGLRLGVLPDSERVHADADVLAAYDSSLETLVELGAEARLFEPLFGFGELAEISGVIMCAEAYSHFGEYVDDEALALDPYSRAFVLRGKSTTARAYLAALRERERLQHVFLESLAGIDVLATPTVGTTAVPFAGLDQTRTMSHFTRFANILDLCALAVPNGFTADELPTSLQLIGRPGGEELLLNVGAAFQNVTDYHRRRPPGLGLD